MRILTVRQPWAWAIIHGQKDVENRVRNIAGSYRGPIAVHAAKTTATLDDEQADFLTGIIPFGEGTDHHYPLGAIIGVVDLVSVHFSGMECGRVPEGTCHEYNLCSEWARAYDYHLVLKDPRPLKTPIQYKGALGLRELPPDITEQIMAGVNHEHP